MTTRDTCDKLFSQLIRLRDGECQIDNCDTGSRLECAHLISRRYDRTRCDERNAVTLCHVHHAHYDREPIEWEQWCRDRIGFAFELLQDLATGNGLPLITPRPDWSEIAAELRARIKHMEAS